MVSSYTSDVLELVKSRNDIVEVISRYFPLKRSGQNHKTLCPFHSEKTPSFLVSSSKQIFHCFGCGVGGDVFSFIMRQEKLTFPEAVRFLAQRADIDLPERETGAVATKTKLLELHELALEYYRWGLAESKNGEKARLYLEKRRIRPDIVSKFKIGYAQPGWDGFVRQAHKKDYQAKDLLEAGLAIARPQGEGYYDRFRDRLIIPICDIQGRVIAFGGRVLDETQPKYINSPDTPLFRKGRMLFGLHLAKESISRAGEAVLGEGYFDVIRAHQEGIVNVICSQGTAFTEDQAQVLKRYSDRVVVAFDADQAGASAALRGLAIFLQKNIEVRIALLPPDEDPDSFISEQGAPSFQNLLKDSIPLLDFKLQKLCERYDIRTDRGKLALSREMLETISRIESAVLRDHYIKKLARSLGVSETSVREDYRKSIRKSRMVVSKPSSRPKAEKYEVRLLKFLLENDNLINLIGDELNSTDFALPFRSIVQAMLDLHHQGKVPLAQSLVAALREEEPKAQVSRWLLEPLDPPVSLKEAADILIDLKKNSIKTKIEALKGESSQAKRLGKPLSRFERESIKLRSEFAVGESQLRNRINKKLGL